MYPTIPPCHHHGPYATQNDFSSLRRHAPCGNGRRSRARGLRRNAERPKARSHSGEPLLAGRRIPQHLSFEAPPHGEVLCPQPGRLPLSLERGTKALGGRSARRDASCGRAGRPQRSGREAADWQSDREPATPGTEKVVCLLLSVNIVGGCRRMPAGLSGWRRLPACGVWKEQPYVLTTFLDSF